MKRLKIKENIWGENFDNIFIYFNKRYIFDIKYVFEYISDTLRRFKNLFFPQNSWLLKEIPKNYADEPELITACVFTCFVFFVEHEMEMVCFNEYPEREKEINYCYNYIRVERIKLKEEMKQLLEDESNFMEYFNKEEEINNKDKEVLKKIIDMKDFLWV